MVVGLNLRWQGTKRKAATYISEKRFSCLVEIKIKKRNALTGVDFLMRGTLEELIHQQSEKLTTKFEKLITGTSQSLVNTKQLFVVEQCWCDLLC